MWFWVENRIIAIHMDHPLPLPGYSCPHSLTSCTRAKVRIRNMGCWAAAVNHCGLAGQFIVTALPTWWQGPRLLSELPPSLCCAYVRRAWILKEVQEVANSLASWSCSPCWTLRRRHKSHTKRPTERIRNLFKNQHFLLPKHTLQYLCVWVFIYAAFFCIFQSQQSETVSGGTRQGGSCSSHFISRNERQSLPQKYAKFAAFTEFMVICVALLMLLNLHLTNGIQLPPRSPYSSPPSSTLRHCELHLDDEISAQRALVLPAHSLSIPVCLCLSVCRPFLAIFQNIFSYILYIAISICVFDDTDSVKLENQTNNDAAHEVPTNEGTQMQTESENYWEYSNAITVAVAIPITVAVSRQADRLAKLK